MVVTNQAWARINFEREILPSLDANKHSWEMGYVAGNIWGDGCLVLEEHRGVVQFVVNDEAHAKAYFDAITKVTNGHATFTRKTGQSRVGILRNGCRIVSNTDRFIVNSCSKYTAAYIDSVCEPLNIINETEDFRRGFIAGSFDSDGYVEKKRDSCIVGFAVKNIEFVNTVSTVLSSISVYNNFSLHKLSGQYRLTIARRNNALKTFAEKIGFRTSYRKEALYSLFESKIRG